MNKLIKTTQHRANQDPDTETWDELSVQIGVYGTTAVSEGA